MTKIVGNRLTISFKVVLLLIICFIVNDICAQNPGGITGTTLWFKGDAGTNTTTNGSLISSWASIAVSPAVTVTQGTTTNQPTFQEGSGSLATTITTNRFNYNPFLYLNGSNYLVENSSIDICNTTTGISAYQVVAYSGPQWVSLGWSGPNGRIKLKADGGGNAITDATGNTGVNNCYSGNTMFQAFLNSAVGTTNGITGRFNGVNVNTSNNNDPTSSLTLTIGANNDASEIMTGGVGEFIIYPSILSATDNLKVESYLAIKYGITLGKPTSLSDYLSSLGIQTWFGDAAFQNDIIGIARDDASALMQKQSHDYSDTTRIYLGTLAATNIANTSTFANTHEFILMGCDNGQVNQTVTSASNVPAGICTRIERVWKVLRTTCSEDFNIDVLPTSLINPLFMNPANLRLLVNSVPDMSTATIYNPTFSVAGGYITATGITTAIIPDNTPTYMAIAIVGDLIVDAGPNIPICPGQSATILATATGSGTLTYSWTPATGLSSTTILDPTANPATNTQYILTVSNGVCTKTDSMIVTIGGTITSVNITASTNPICVGNTTTLTATGANTYTWSTGATTNAITVSPTVSTSYIVTGDVSGCTGNDTFNIRVVPYPVVDLGPDSLICTGTTLILKAPTPGYTYLWQDNSTASTYSASLPGTYWVQVTDSFNCSTTASVVITNLNPPAFPLPTDTSLCQGTSYNIVIPSGPYNVYWSDGTNDFTNSFNQAGTFGVTVSNKCGSIYNSFTIKYNDCSCYLYFPNAFTPGNGDGLNDYFGPVYQCNFITYHLYIYNRWGQLVYDTESPTQQWDGKSKTEDVEAGVYVWRLFYTAEYVIGPQSKNGTITVLR